jgi:hypothetical protein
MKRAAENKSRLLLRSAAATREARKLMRAVDAILAEFPEADREDVKHTLVLLRMPPWERLERSLRRGRATAVLAR